MDARDITIAKPCELDWQKMTAADRGRFCAECKKVVRDISSMSEKEARATLRNEGGGELCVRYLYDKNGKVLFAGEAEGRSIVPVGVLVRNAKRLAKAAVTIAPLALAACTAQVENGMLGQQLVKNEETSDPSPPTTDPVYENMGGAPYYEPDAGPQPESDGGDADADPDANDTDASDTDASDTDAGPAEDAGEPTPHI